MTATPPEPELPPKALGYALRELAGALQAAIAGGRTACSVYNVCGGWCDVHRLAPRSQKRCGWGHLGRGPDTWGVGIVELVKLVEEGRLSGSIKGRVEAFELEVDRLHASVCRSVDPYECWSLRYEGIGSLGRWPSRQDVEDDGGPCQCQCHQPYWREIARGEEVLRALTEEEEDP